MKGAQGSPLARGRRAGSGAAALLVLGIVLAMPTTGTAAEAPASLDAGRLLFRQGAVPSCAVCHTLKDAGSAGAVGPVLDELQPDAERVLRALRNGVGAMPSFRERLSDAQMQALAGYVAWASRQP